MLAKSIGQNFVRYWWKAKERLLILPHLLEEWMGVPVGKAHKDRTSQNPDREEALNSQGRGSYLFD